MIKNGKIIKFDGDERWLSNMVTTLPFEYEGIVYHSTENAYQALSVLMKMKSFIFHN